MRTMKKKKPKKPQKKGVELQTRKYLGILVNSRFFNAFCKKGVFMIEKSPIPDDAKYIHSFLDPCRDGVVIVFEHDSFRELNEGEYVPISTDVRITRLYELEYELERVWNKYEKPESIL